MFCINCLWYNGLDKILLIVKYNILEDNIDVNNFMIVRVKSFIVS